MATDLNHQRCVSFIARLAQHGLTVVDVSSLMWMEFAHHVTRERFRLVLAGDVRRTYRLHRWHDPLVREAYLQAMLRTLENLLAQFEWHEVALTETIRRDATRLMAEYNLRSYDAVYLASARAVGVADFASLDRGYRRVDGLQLWNDRIFSGEPVQ